MYSKKKHGVTIGNDDIKSMCGCPVSAKKYRDLVDWYA